MTRETTNTQLINVKWSKEDLWNPEAALALDSRQIPPCSTQKEDLWNP